MSATPYRLFDVTLARRERLTPSLIRLTFGGDDVRAMATHAADQRIKIFFPNAEGRPSALAKRPDWYAAWKAQDAAARPPMRTYTIRALRAEAGEVDVDFVLHGETGPASTWATRAALGDAVQIVAPDRGFEGEGGGFEWRPPADMRRLLLMADETGLPALAGILEDLARRPHPPATQAIVEVPLEADRIQLPCWPRLVVSWLAREARPGHPAPGALLVEAAADALPMRPSAPAGQALDDIDVDSQILWDRATEAADGFYAWIAAEAGAVKAIRHLMVRERGIDRSAVNLMGYWRLGQVLD